MMGDKRVIIIGGGVIGLCSAYYLSKKGFEVTVIEKGDGTDGCSYGNAGMVVPSHFIPLAAPGMIALGIKWLFNAESPFYIKPRFNRDLFSWGWKFYKAATKSKVEKAMPVLRDLNLMSRELYDELAREEDLQFAFQKKGLFMYCKTEHAFEEESALAKKANKLGVKAEILSQQEAQSLDPSLQLDIAGAVYFPNDAFMTPHLFMERLQKKLEALGVNFRFNTLLKSINTSNNQINAVVVGNEELVADKYVIALGSWSSDLLKQINMDLPMQAGKGYSVVLPDPVSKPEICSILTEARVAVTPMTHGLRFAGTMEITGLDESINHRRLQGIFKSIPKYFPEFKKEDFTELQVWSGLRPCSPDGLPYIGKSDVYKNLIIATGHAMMGLSLGPVTGKLVSQIMTEDKTSLDISLLDPNRYN
ncbi:FAD-dependent oxidoreductase [Fulvivirgaceae bacterium BMA10]|uniref:FAD-dependent oxidoreductase n=1 Tax=Splendidivirga corallicola TaxID=3051826 RepID=A0ABT8KHA5_9BACT|nr:FAD-dependent oxidoreductase [Fulvivirgaceae bacterium BMA10]